MDIRCSNRRCTMHDCSILSSRLRSKLSRGNSYKGRGTSMKHFKLFAGIILALLVCSVASALPTCTGIETPTNDPCYYYTSEEECTGHYQNLTPTFYQCEWNAGISHCDSVDCDGSSGAADMCFFNQTTLCGTNNWEAVFCVGESANAPGVLINYPPYSGGRDHLMTGATYTDGCFRQTFSYSYLSVGVNNISCYDTVVYGYPDVLPGSNTITYSASCGGTTTTTTTTSTTTTTTGGACPFTNGGFETGDFTGWSQFGGGGTINSNNTFVHNGTYSAKLYAVYGAGNASGVSQNIGSTQIPFCFWYDITYCSSPGNSQLRISNGSADIFTLSCSGLSLPSSGYTCLTNAGNLTFYDSCSSGGCNMTAYIDDVGCETSTTTTTTSTTTTSTTTTTTGSTTTTTTPGGCPFSNGGFETGDLTGWTAFGGGATINANASFVNNGTYSAKMIGSLSNASGVSKNIGSTPITFCFWYDIAECSPTQSFGQFRVSNGLTDIFILNCNGLSLPYSNYTCLTDSGNIIFYASYSSTGHTTAYLDDVSCSTTSTSTTTSSTVTSTSTTTTTGGTTTTNNCPAGEIYGPTGFAGSGVSNGAYDNIFSSSGFSGFPMMTQLHNGTMFVAYANSPISGSHPSTYNLTGQTYNDGTHAWSTPFTIIPAGQNGSLEVNAQEIVEQYINGYWEIIIPYVNVMSVSPTRNYTQLVATSINGGQSWNYTALFATGGSVDQLDITSGHATVLRNGYIMLALQRSDQSFTRFNDAMLLSNDGFHTWSIVNVTSPTDQFNEFGLVDRGNGSYYVLTRTEVGGSDHYYAWNTNSSDYGATWNTPVRTVLSSGGRRPDVFMLTSGYGLAALTTGSGSSGTYQTLYMSSDYADWSDSYVIDNAGWANAGHISCIQRNDTVGYCVWYPDNGNGGIRGNQFNMTAECVGNPNPTTTTTTTTSTSTSTTSTTMFLTNATVYTGNHTQINYDCSNLSGKFKRGEYVALGICGYTMPLGTDWTYGLTCLFLCFAVYKATKTLLAVSFVGIVVTTIFYLYLPQPTVSLLGLVVAVSIAAALYEFFLHNKR